MSKQLDWFIGKQQKHDSFVVGQSKTKPQTEYKKKWETPPKFKHKGIMTTCVAVAVALLEDEPQTESEDVE